MKKPEEKAELLALLEYYFLLSDATRKLVDGGVSTLDAADARLLYPRFLMQYRMTSSQNFYWPSNHPLSETRMQSTIVKHQGIPDCNYIDKEVLDTLKILVEDSPKKDLLRFIIETLHNTLEHINNILKNKNNFLTEENRDYLVVKRKIACNQYIKIEFKLLLEELNEAPDRNTREEIIRAYIERVNKLIDDWKDDLDEEQKIINFDTIAVAKINLENIDLHHVRIPEEHLSQALGLYRVKGLEGKPLWENALKLKRKAELPLSQDQEYKSVSPRIKSPRVVELENLMPGNLPVTPRTPRIENDEHNKFYIQQAFDAIDKKEYDKLNLLLESRSTYEKSHAASLERNLEMARFQLKLLEFEENIINDQIDKLKDFYQPELDLSVESIKKILSIIPEATLYDQLLKNSKEYPHATKTLWIDEYSFNLPDEVDLYLQYYRKKLSNLTGQYACRWLPKIKWWVGDDDANHDALLNDLNKRKRELRSKIIKIVKSINKLITENVRNNVRLTIAGQVKALFASNTALSNELKLSSSHVYLSANARNPKTGETLLYSAIRSKDLVVINILLRNSACLFQPIKQDESYDTSFKLALSLLDFEPQILIYICKYLLLTPLKRLIYPVSYAYILQNEILKEMIKLFEQLKTKLDEWILNNLEVSSDYLIVTQRNIFIEVYENLFNAANELAPDVLLNQLRTICSRYQDESHPMHQSELLKIVNHFIPALEASDNEEFNQAKFNYVNFSMSSKTRLEQKLMLDSDLILLSPRRFDRIRRSSEDQEKRQFLDERAQTMVRIRRNSLNGKRFSQHTRSSSAPSIERADNPGPSEDSLNKGPT